MTCTATLCVEKGGNKKAKQKLEKIEQKAQDAEARARPSAAGDRQAPCRSCKHQVEGSGACVQVILHIHRASINLKNLAHTQQITTFADVGLRYKDLGDINQAIFYLLKSVRLKPDAKVHEIRCPSISAFGRLTSIQVFVALAELYEEADRYSDAVATYQRSLKLNPGQTSIFYRITRILIRLHQEDTAKPHLSEAERWAAKYGSLIPSSSLLVLTAVSCRVEQLERGDPAVAELKSDILKLKGSALALLTCM